MNRGSTAIPTWALAQLVKPLLAADLAVKSKVLMAAVAPYVYWPLHPSHVQRLRAAASYAIVGDPLDELQKLPAYVQSLIDSVCGRGLRDLPALNRSAHVLFSVFDSACLLAGDWSPLC